MRCLPVRFRRGRSSRCGNKRECRVLGSKKGLFLAFKTYSPHTLPFVPHVSPFELSFDDKRIKFRKDLIYVIFIVDVQIDRL